MAAIDTDMALATILSHFDSNYVTHVILDSLDMSKRFRPFNEPMPNFVDILNRNLLAVINNSPDYIDKVNDARSDTFKEIIKIICNYYHLGFTMPFEEISPEELFGIAHTMYDLFVSGFTKNAVQFFVSYIMRNIDPILSELQSDPNMIKPKETGVYDQKNFVDQKYILLHANINSIIYNIAAHDITLDMLLSYFLEPISYQRLTSILVDNGDIYKNYYAICLTDQVYKAPMITSIKLALQSYTYQVHQIETK